MAHTLAHDYTSSNRTRHIERRDTIVRERIADATQKLRLVPTADNWADLWTKVLDRRPFEKFRAIVMQIARVSIEHASLLLPTHRRGRDTRV